jgi:integrase
MALSDLVVRQTKASGKAFTLANFDGLALYISPKGSKAWHFRYSWGGKQRRISFGTYPEVSLQEARCLRDEARSLVSKGINPQIHRKQKRRAVRLASENNFRAVYLQWFEHRKLELKAGRQSTLSQIERIFDNDVLPSLATTSIFDIQRSDLLEVVARIEARGAVSIAEKVRTWLNQLFRFALVKIDGLTHNPAADLDVVAVPKPPVINNPYLRLKDLPDFLHALRAYAGEVMTQLGIRLLLLTGVRTGELRLAMPHQFDLECGLWIIPPEIVKQLQESMRKQRKRAQDIPAYIVPLSNQAITVIRYLLAKMKPNQTYLLAHRSDLKKMY